MSDALTGLGATFLEFEEQTGGAVMNAGAVMVFEATPSGGPPSLEELVAVVDGRLAATPRLGQRLSEERTHGLAWPRWVSDERFQTIDHMRRVALPAPRDESQLCDWIADFYSHRLDRTRPLWEMALIEEMQDARWAVAIKVHPCLLDQVTPNALFALLLDAWPAPEPPDTAPLRTDTQPPASHPLLPATPAPVAQAAHAGSRATRSAVRATLHPRHTLAQARTLAELIAADEIIGAPGCSLQQPVGAARRYAAVHCRRADLETIRDALGGTLEDALLAACAAGLRNLLSEREEKLSPRPLHGMVAIGPPAGSLDLRVRMLIVELPLSEPSSIVRHRRIVECRRHLRRIKAGESAGSVIDLTELAPPLLHATVVRSLFGTRLFNVAIAGWYGATEPRYAFGAELREVHPITPLAASHTVAIAVAIYEDRVTFGITADRESTPDLAALAYGVAEGVRELYAAACHGRLVPSLQAGQPAPVNP